MGLRLICPREYKGEGKFGLQIIFPNIEEEQEKKSASQNRGEKSLGKGI